MSIFQNKEKEVEKGLFDIAEAEAEVKRLDELAEEKEEMLFNEDLQLEDNAFVLPMEEFGPLRKYVEDDAYTDIDFNGRDLWVKGYDSNKVKIYDPEVNADFINQFARKVANAQSKEFNNQNARLEAETKDLRIAILHDTVATSGITVCIRKTPPVARITEREAVESLYASPEVLELLANCVKAHMTTIICGQPGAGKTELAKFMSTYIPDQERVITIEDVKEWRYSKLKPNADCIEMKAKTKKIKKGDFDYADCIISALKLNPAWIMVAETRGYEVMELLQGFSTGVNGISTLHTDSVKKIPDRMLNMSYDDKNERRIRSNIYEFVNVGIMVVVKVDPLTGKKYRCIDEVGFFTRENEVESCTLAVVDGQVVNRELPISVLLKFARGGVKNNIFENKTVMKKLVDQGMKEEDIDSYNCMKSKSLEELAFDNENIEMQTLQDSGLITDVRRYKKQKSTVERANAGYEPYARFM